MRSKTPEEKQINLQNGDFIPNAEFGLIELP